MLYNVFLIYAVRDSIRPLLLLDIVFPFRSHLKRSTWQNESRPLGLFVKRKNYLLEEFQGLIKISEVILGLRKLFYYRNEFLF